jgi:hypothetical protein
MRSKADCGDKLNNVICEYGIPEYGLHMDNAGEETGAFTKKISFCIFYINTVLRTVLYAGVP